MKKRCFLCLMIICISLLQGLWIVQGESVSMAGILVNYSFGYFEISIDSLFGLSINFFSIILFQIVEGIMIYKELCVAGIYIFSRCPNRRKWLIKQYVSLLAYSVIYTCCRYIPPMILGFLNENIFIEDGVLNILFAQIFIYSMWLFGTTVITNCFAMIAGSYHGEAIILFCQFFMIGIMNLWSDNGPLSLAASNINREYHFMLLKANPIAHLILALHSSKYNDLSECINVYHMNFELLSSVLFMLGICLAASIIGLFMINRIDFLKTENMS